MTSRRTGAAIALAAAALAAAPWGTLAAQEGSTRAGAAAPGGAAVQAVAPPAAERVPITHEALWLMKRVGTPEPSPDGRWVVFAVTEPSYVAEAQVTDLWLVPADGSAPARRLTATRGGESDVAWSPDGRRLAFSAKREGDEAAQVYVLDVAGGGEAVRVTGVAGGARQPRWSPDGRLLLFTSTVYPGARSDEENRRAAEAVKARKHRARVYDGFPIRSWDRWLDVTQPHLFVQLAEPGAGARDLLAGTQLASAAGFSGGGNGGDRLDAAWAPDGRSVVFAAATNRHRAAYSDVAFQLFEVGVEGGEPRALTEGPDSYGSPGFSPDGRRLYALVTPGTEYVYNHTRLAAFGWPGGGRAEVLTAGWDRSVDEYEPAPDGRTVYLVAEEEGHDRVYAMPASGGEPRPLVEPAAGVYAGVKAAGRGRAAVLVARWESAVEPPEIVRLDPAGGGHRRLTSLNVEAAAAIDWQPVRPFRFTSGRGKRIHNFLVVPPGFDETRKYPLLVVMHGGPHSAWKDQFVIRWNYHLLGSPGYVVLLTNYAGSTGYGEAFARGVQLDPLAGPAEEINQAADEAIRRFPFVDGSRQAAAGASYGGHLAYWMAGVTDRYRALVAHAGAINMESQWGTSDVIYHREVYFGGPPWEQGPVWREQNPVRLAANFRTPMLITVGERDYRVPLNNTIEAWNVLQRQRVPSRLIVFPDENHWVLDGENSRFFYRELHAWLDRWLGGEGEAHSPE